MCDDMTSKTVLPDDNERERDVDDLIFTDPCHLPSDR